MHSPFVGDTTFADLLVLAAITCMGLVLTHNKKQRQGEIPGVSKRYMFALGLIAVPIVVAVYLSAMRAPVVALVGGGFVLSMMTGPGAGAAWATVSIGLLAAGPRVLLLKLGWVLAGNPIDRYILWNEGARLLGELPFFGFGPNSFAHILSENALGSFTSRVPTSWHNDFLQTALESGLMAALAYAGCVLGIAHQVFQRAVARGGVYWREFGVLTVLLAAIIFFSLVGSVVSTSILGVLQWTVLGLAANVSRREQ